MDFCINDRYHGSFKPPYHVTVNLWWRAGVTPPGPRLGSWTPRRPLRPVPRRGPGIPRVDRPGKMSRRLRPDEVGRVIRADPWSMRSGGWGRRPAPSPSSANRGGTDAGWGPIPIRAIRRPGRNDVRRCGPPDEASTSAMAAARRPAVPPLQANSALGIFDL